MSWAKHAIELLQQDKNAVITPHGNSMKPLINSGDQVGLCPIRETTLIRTDDIVLVKVKGNVYLHLVKATRQVKEKEQYQIGNNKGGINGWVNRTAIYGKVITVKGTI